MKTRSVRAVLTGVLVFTMIWPLCQFAFVSAVDASPWKLFGLAMYSTVYETSVEVYDATTLPVSRLDTANLASRPRNALHRFRRYRHVFGRLAKPDSLAQRLFDNRPDSQAIRVVATTRKLSSTSGKLLSSRQIYEYRRP